MLSSSNFLEPGRMIRSDIRGPIVPSLVQAADVVFCNNYVFHGFESRPTETNASPSNRVDGRCTPLNGELQTMLREFMTPGALLITTSPLTDGRHINSSSHRNNGFLSLQPVKSFELPPGGVSWKAGPVKAYIATLK